MARPLIGRRELHLDWLILPAKLAQPHPYPFKGRLGSQTFPRCSSTGKQSLDLVELLAQLRLDGHALPRINPRKQAQHRARPKSTLHRQYPREQVQITRRCAQGLKTVVAPRRLQTLA
jgi:hypothetical protein